VGLRSREFLGQLMDSNSEALLHIVSYIFGKPEKPDVFLNEIMF
jgi:hypothetical protein